MNATLSKTLLFGGAIGSALLGAWSVRWFTATADTDGVEVHMHSLVIDRDLAEYARDAELIVVGVVGASGAPYRVPAFERQGTPDSVQHDVSVRVDEVLKGDPTLESVPVAVEGGRVGKMTVLAEDAVELKEGEEVLLFLGVNHRGDYVVYAGPNGKYRVDAGGNAEGFDGFKTTVDDVRDLLNTDPG